MAVLPRSFPARPAHRTCGSGRPGPCAAGLAHAAAGGPGAVQAALLDDTGRNPLSHDGALPLLHKRVLVTAPRQYAQKLCSRLVNAGARPLWVPGVSVTEVTDAEQLLQLDRALLPLLGGAGRTAPPYTHIAFTSKNGIYALVNRLAHLAGGLPAAVEALRSCGASLCALGADGEVLTGLGLPLHVSPAEASTQGLVRELAASGAARGASVLCPVPLVTGGLTEPAVVPRFLKALQDAGARPQRADAYVTSPGTSAEACAAEVGLLRSGQVHAVAFSSTAEAQGLLQIVGGQRILHEAVLQHGVVLAAHGPYTAAGASEVLGLPINCVSQSFKTFDGLVAALEGHFMGL